MALYDISTQTCGFCPSDRFHFESHGQVSMNDPAEPCSAYGLPLPCSSLGTERRPRPNRVGPLGPEGPKEETRAWAVLAFLGTSTVFVFF